MGLMTAYHLVPRLLSPVTPIVDDYELLSTKSDTCSRGEIE